MKANSRQVDSGFGRAWFALTVAFTLHVIDEATTGFLQVYNPTVSAMRARWGWFPLPTFEFREWLVGLIAGVLLCVALTPMAARGVRALRPLAWFYALLMFFNGMGHRLFTVLGRTVAAVTFRVRLPDFIPRPFCSSGQCGRSCACGGPEPDAEQPPRLSRQSEAETSIRHSGENRSRRAALDGQPRAAVPT